MISSINCIDDECSPLRCVCALILDTLLDWSQEVYILPQLC